MSRPTTALQEWDVPGMPGKPIRLRAAKPGPDGQPGRSLRITYYEPGTGKAKETTAIGTDAARARVAELLTSLTAASLAPGAMSPLPALIDRYLLTRAEQREWSLKTRKGKEEVYRSLPAWFLALLCYEWTIEASEDLLAEVALRTPRGTEGYRRVATFLTGMRTCAWRYGYMPRSTDPMHAIEYAVRRKQSGTTTEPASPAGQIRPVRPEEIPTDEKARELAEAAAWLSGCWWEELRVLLWRYAGLRWGESADLRLPQVNLDRENPTIHVVRQAVEVSGGAKSLHLGMPPKGGGHRFTFYDPRLTDLLERRFWEVKRDRNAPADPGGALVLPSPRGLVYRRSNWARQVGTPAMAAALWPRMSDQDDIPLGTKTAGWLWTPHSLRHGYATWCIRELHIPVALVSEWMGHSSVTITERLYVARDVPQTGAGVAAMRKAKLIPEKPE